MINTDYGHLLFIEPKLAPTAPIVDDYTRIVTAAWRARTDAQARCRGQHSCTGRSCSAMSGNGNHSFAGFELNSLAIHYIACHRAEVPEHELRKILTLKILTLPPAEADPTVGEIAGQWRACDTRGV